MDFSAFPGADVIARGVADLQAQQTTIESLLVLIGAPRLRAVGIEIPSSSVTDPDHRLFELLALSDPDGAHSRYNALLRELISFERAAECAA